MEIALTRALPALAGSLAPGGAAEDLLRAVTEHTPVGVFLSDTEGSCRFVNQRWCELTGLTVDQALGDGWTAALHPDDRERVGTEWQQAASVGRDSVISYRFRRPDGSVVWIDGYASAFHDSSGNLVGWVGACLDVTAHQRTESELLTQAHTDPLTGLPNRRALEQRLELETAHQPGQRNVSVILLDLDRFKAVNDRYGHTTGDKVLVAVADTLRERVRQSDLAVRLGGDEFAVVVRSDDPQPLARDLIAAISTLSIEDHGHEITLTASAGTATLASPHPSDQNLLDAADHALYRAKHAGRNRTVAAGQLIAA